MIEEAIKQLQEFARRFAATTDGHTMYPGMVVWVVGNSNATHSDTIFAVGTHKWNTGSDWIDMGRVNCFLSEANANLYIAERLESEAKKFREAAESE